MKPVPRNARRLVRLYRSHSSDTDWSSGISAGPCRVDDLELAAEARDLPVRFPQLGTEFFDRKLLQWHDGLLAYSPHSETKLAANLSRGLPTPKKTGQPPWLAASVASWHNEIAPARERPDRIPQHDPAPPDNAEHHEAVACWVEENAFVPEQCEVGPRLGGLCDDLGSPRQGVLTGDAGLRCSGASRRTAAAARAITATATEARRKREASP